MNTRKSISDKSINFLSIINIIQYCIDKKFDFGFLSSYINNFLKKDLFDLLPYNNELIIFNRTILLENSNDISFINILNCSPSCIVQIYPLRIVSKFNNYFKDDISTITSFNKVIVTQIYNGIPLIIFTHNNNSYISSEYSLYGDNIINGKPITSIFNKYFYYSKFKENVNECYHFLLVMTTKNFNDKYGIVQYKTKVFYKNTSLIYDLNHYINDDIFLKDNMCDIVPFESKENIYRSLNILSQDSLKSTKINIIGYEIIDYNTNTSYQLFTETYKCITKSMSKFDNVTQLYLDLYKKDIIPKIIPYLTKNKNEEINMMSLFLKNITDEIYNIYNLILQNENLINDLPYSYNSIIIYLNKLHEIKNIYHEDRASIQYKDEYQKKCKTYENKFINHEDDKSNIYSIDKTKTDPSDKSNTDSINKTVTDSSDKSNMCSIAKTKTDLSGKSKTDLIYKSKTDSFDKSKTDSFDKSKTDSFDKSKMDSIDKQKFLLSKRGIRKMYTDKKATDFYNKKNISIKIHDIYHHLKYNKSTEELLLLFNDRKLLLDNKNFNYFLHKDCPFTKAQLLKLEKKLNETINKNY
jgi:hypothetical protein